MKHNQLVANCLIFANVWMLTRVFQGVQEEGIPVGAEDVAALSPSGREHLIRFGRYTRDRERTPAPIDYTAPVTSAARETVRRRPLVESKWPKKSRIVAVPPQRQAI